MYHELPMKGWNRQCSQEGLDWLLDWIRENRDAVLTVEMTYDPEIVQPSTGTITYTGSFDNDDDSSGGEI